MPELPEVEVSRRGIAPDLEGRTILGAAVRCARLRLDLDPQLPEILRGRQVRRVTRRGKYLLLDCPGAADSGTLIIHLGMSGSLRFVAPGTPPQAHDHFDLAIADRLLRFRDPRRFGLIVWIPGPDPLAHPLFAHLGPEPLGPEFTGRWLHQALQRRSQAIKPVLMDASLVVGVGNIYASESLFRSGISPLRAANRIAARRCDALAAAVQATLADAIAAGGSSVRDYVHSDGGAGCFQISAAVYERAGEPCRQCGTPIRQIRQAGRSTFYCPHCQR
jgi:formamidopyrimidine-DNA glycosylase